MSNGSEKVTITVKVETKKKGQRKPEIREISVSQTLTNVSRRRGQLSPQKVLNAALGAFKQTPPALEDKKK